MKSTSIEGKDTHIHTNCKTYRRDPQTQRHRVIPTLSRGVTTILARVSTVITPCGNVSPGRKRRKVGALPRYIKPIGTLAVPTKSAVSRIKASGGSPSGATGRMPDGGREAPLSGSTSAITTEIAITTGMGLSHSVKVLQTGVESA